MIATCTSSFLPAYLLAGPRLGFSHKDEESEQKLHGRPSWHSALAHALTDYSDSQYDIDIATMLHIVLLMYA